MNYHIRKAKPTDLQHILDLIVELAVFEKEPNAVEVTVDELMSSGFGVRPDFTCFVAETNTKIVGIALVYTRFSTWKGRVLHLEDLIVSEVMRGQGIGSALLDQVVRFADELKVKRISWEVLDWNTPAIEFYEAKGADVKRDWDVVHLNEEGIKNYLSKL
ncbi:MAG: GNAT family N-acetyltransferase [Flavobacteriaceae bacterium]